MRKDDVRASAPQINENFRPDLNQALVDEKSYPTQGLQNHILVARHANTVNNQRLI